MNALDSHTYRFVPAEKPAAPVLLLLHGTGGNENDLLPLGKQLAPGAALLSVRGNVLENGMPRFFRRLAEGVFDHEDLVKRTDELARFLEAAANSHGFAREQLVALGYSNGANIASSLMFRHPDRLQAAILLRGMVPFQPDATLQLDHHQVLLCAGREDQLIDVPETERLLKILQSAGAATEIHWHQGGHQLGQDDFRAAAGWLQARFALS